MVIVGGEINAIVVDEFVDSAPLDEISMEKNEFSSTTVQESDQIQQKKRFRLGSQDSTNCSDLNGTTPPIRFEEDDKSNASTDKSLINGNHGESAEPEKSGVSSRRLRHREAPFTIKTAMDKKANFQQKFDIVGTAAPRGSKRKVENQNRKKKQDDKKEDFGKNREADEIDDDVIFDGITSVINSVIETGMRFGDGSPGSSVLDFKPVKMEIDDNGLGDSPRAEKGHELMEQAIETTKPVAFDATSSPPFLAYCARTANMPKRPLASSIVKSSKVLIKSASLPVFRHRIASPAPRPRASPRPAAAIALDLGRKSEEIAHQVSHDVCSPSQAVQFCLKNGSDHIPMFKNLDDACSFICSMCDRRLHDTKPSYVVVRFPACRQCADECSVTIDTGDQSTKIDNASL